MEKKLIFLDIDGTLTIPGTNTPPDSALRAVRRARENGHPVFLCTGRNMDMLSPVLALGFDGAVASAGGYVIAGDRVLFDCPMTAAQRDTAMSLLRENGVFRTVEAKDGAWCDEDRGDFYRELDGGSSEMERIHRQISEALHIRPMEEYDGRPVYKILFMCRDARQLEPARRALERDFDFVVQDGHRPGLVDGEIINRRFDKGRGVRRVAEALGFALADTIGFGDSMNDLEMIRTVGVSVCMENGSPTLKKASSRVCPPVDRDGLARAFEDLGLCGGPRL